MRTDDSNFTKAVHILENRKLNYQNIKVVKEYFKNENREAFRIFTQASKGECTLGHFLENL